jgi:hypothetical protein
MRQIASLSCFAGLSFIAASAFAQNPQLIIDNSQFNFESPSVDWVTINPTDGSVRVNSTGAGGNPVQPLSCSRGQPNSPTVALGGVPTTNVTPGQQFTVTWSSSNTQTGNSTPCTRSGTGTEWAPGGNPVANQAANNPTGIAVTIPAGSTNGQQFTFTLTCQGNGGSSGLDSRTVTVNVSNDPNCPVSNPHGLSQIGSPTTWPGTFRGQGGFNNGNAVSLSPGECMALSFNSGQIASPPVWTTGFLQMFTSTSGTQGAQSVSISRCPCDYRSTVLITSGQTCMTQPASKVSLGWRVVAQPTDIASQCPLLTNTDYFVNITYGNASSQFGFCPGGGCKSIGGNTCQGTCP